MSFRKSSHFQDPMEATGSFTGTFDGDGSGITGVSADGGTADTASFVAGANVDGAVESASFADSALAANTATSATSASHAVQADNAKTADFATQADNATTADSATTAGSATTATSASHAVQADNADAAISASHALQADNAATADAAVSASHALRAVGFTGTFDADNADGDGKWRHKTTTPTVGRTSLGLIFRDQFNRADSATVGNDWIPNAAGTDIQDNKLRVLGATGILTASFFTGSTTAERFPTGGLLDLPTKYIVQTNHAFNSNAGSARVSTLARADSIERTGSFSNYEALTGKAEEAFHSLQARVTGGQSPSIQGPGLSLTSGSFYGTRLILEDLGNDILAVSGAWTLELSSSTDLSAPFEFEILSFTNAENSNPETNIVGIHTQDDQFADEFIIQGVEVLVTGLPSGFKASLDGDTSVVESGGTATINVRTRALPFATISIFDTDDVVQAQIFPQSASLSDGWGGDTYAYDEQEYQFIPISGSGEEESVVLALQRDGAIVGSFTGTFDGDGTGITGIVHATASHVAGADVFGAVALADTASHALDFDGDVSASLILGTVDSASVALLANTASFLLGIADTNLIGTTTGTEDLTFRTADTNRWKIVSSSGFLVPVVDKDVSIGVLGGPRPKDLDLGRKMRVRRGPSGGSVLDVGQEGGTFNPVFRVSAGEAGGSKVDFNFDIDALPHALVHFNQSGRSFLEINTSGSATFSFDLQADNLVILGSASFAGDIDATNATITGTFVGDGAGITGIVHATASHVAGADVFGAVGLADTASFLTGSADTNLVGPTGSDDLTFRTADTPRWRIISSSGDLLPAVDDSYDIGSTILGLRPQDLNLSRKIRVLRDGGGRVAEFGIDGATNNPSLTITTLDIPAKITIDLQAGAGTGSAPVIDFRRGGTAYLQVDALGAVTLSGDLQVADNLVVGGSSSFAGDIDATNATITGTFDGDGALITGIVHATASHVAGADVFGTVGSADTASFGNPSLFNSPRPIKTIANTNPYVVLSTDHTVLINAVSGVAAITVTLPDIADFVFGDASRVLSIIKTSGANEVVLVASGTQDIIGDPSATLLDDFQGLTLQPSGTTWWVI